MAKVISDGKDAVDQFLKTLDHPRLSEIETLRSIIMDADAAITEKVKWNAPSFYFNDDFATMKLRPGATLQLIMHTGARAPCVHMNAQRSLYLSESRASFRFK